jgi:hypothetical protein
MRSNLLWVRPTVYPLLAAVLALANCRQPAPPTPDAPAQPPPVRAVWMPPDAVEVGSGSDYPFGLALAPDGRRLAFPGTHTGRVSLWLQDLATGEARSLAATDGAAAPFWSPDGARVGFLAQGRWQSIELASGSIGDLAEAADGRGATWNQAGDLVFAGAGGLQRRAANGTVTPLTTLDREAGESAHSWPAFLPDGRHVAFLVTSNERARAGIWLAPLDNPASRAKIASSDAQPVIAGRTLLLLSDTTLLAQPLDPTTWKADGRSMPAGLAAGRGPLGQLLATAAGEVLIYGAPGSRLRELRWLSATGETLGRAGEAAESWDLRIAPDGRRVAVTQLDPQLRTLDVWIREGAQAPTRLSLGTDVDESAVWSPNGLRVAWVGKRRNILVRGAGAVLPEQTIGTYEPPVQLWDWSRDGALLLTGRASAQSGDDLWTVPQADGAKPAPYVTGSFNQTYGAFSPNGRWVAYASNESGQSEIYIDSFPKPGTRLRATTAGGTEPRWKGDGSALYFRRGSEVHVVRLVPKPPTLEVGAVDRLFDAGATIRAFDVTADGSRFLVNVPATGSAPRSATMVVNWH